MGLSSRFEPIAFLYGFGQCRPLTLEILCRGVPREIDQGLLNTWRKAVESDNGEGTPQQLMDANQFVEKFGADPRLGQLDGGVFIVF